jgi:hypothetical protein
MIGGGKAISSKNVANNDHMTVTLAVFSAKTSIGHDLDLTFYHAG